MRLLIRCFLLCFVGGCACSEFGAGAPGGERAGGDDND